MTNDSLALPVTQQSKVYVKELEGNWDLSGVPRNFQRWNLSNSVRNKISKTTNMTLQQML